MNKGKLFAIGMLQTLVIIFSSCSKAPETSTNVSPSPTPQEAKMEAQSANWKVSVVSVDAVPKQEAMYVPMQPKVEGPDNKYDTLQLTVDLSYTGPAQDVESPSATLIDGAGRKTEAVKTLLEMPGTIYSISFGPGYSSLQTLFTGEQAPNPDEREMEQQGKTAKELLLWLDPESVATYKKKPRGLKGGEKFTTIYMFQDPKEYTNLKLAFNDLPPITLKAPKDHKAGTAK